MPWTQNYDPFGSPWLSPMAAAVPVVLLLGLLATGRVSALRAAAAGLAAAVLMAICAFTPAEVGTEGGGGLAGWAGAILAAAGYGAAFGLLPIGWIVRV
jgi:lactate permease